MAHETIYASEPTSIRPYVLSDAELLGIGRLVRACAEIENIISLYLFNLAGISEGVGIALLGKLPSSARLRLIEQLMTSINPELLEVYRGFFDNENYRGIIRFRNTVAHGSLLGLTDDDRVAFVVQDTQAFEDGGVVLNVNAYEHGAFAGVATQAENIIPQMERILCVQASRDKRRGPILDPHVKTRRKQSKSTATPPRPPRA